MNARAPTAPAPRPPQINHTPLPQVRRILAVGSGKGGVGKSTVTVSLAHAFTAQGLRVGILDADLYGPSIPRMLGLEPYLKPEIEDGWMLPPQAHGIRALSMALLTGQQAAVLRAPMITKLLVQFLRQARWGTAQAPLDLLLVDLPPGTGDVLLSLAQQAPLDGALVVSTPQAVAIDDADKCAQALRALRVPLLGVIENMARLETAAGAPLYPFGQGGGARLAAQHQVPLLVSLPLEPALGSALERGENYARTAPSSQLIQEIAALTTRLLTP